MPVREPVLQLKGIAKGYPGVVAVDGVDLAFLPGEVHALVGENGAGKSTLIKILAGAVHADAGEIWLRGEHVHIASGADAYRLGLSFIHQESSLIPYLSAPENIYLGRPYPKRAFGLVDWRTLRANAASVLHELGAAVPLDVPVSRLPNGERAMVAIARGFAGQASIFVLDEPTAALTDNDIERLFAVIRALKAQGRTIIYVSHRLDEIFELADRVTVMRNGTVVGTYPTAEIDRRQLIALMIGRSMAETLYPPPQAPAGETLLEAEGLQNDRVQGVSLTVRRGEIVGLAGLVGAGRTEVLRMLYGADPVAAGRLRLAGRPFRPGSPAEAIRRGVVLVPEERRSQGLVLNFPIVRNITLPHLAAFTTGGVFLDQRRELAASERAGQAVRLKATGAGQRVWQLSGGNQQKVVFARWLVREAQVLMLDEPTRGVDVGARAEIYRIIRDLATQGLGILLVSSDLEELLGLADRLIVLREGRMVAELPAAGLDQQHLLKYCYGEAS